MERALIDACDNLNEEEEKEIEKCLFDLDSSKEVPTMKDVGKLPQGVKDEEQKLDLKILPSHLKYVFLEDGGKKPVIISSSLSPSQEKKLIDVIVENQGAIGWTLSDLKGISPSYCMHHIHMEQDFKPLAQPQRRLNPTMKEVVKKEVMKLLDAGMIYPISDSTWVSPV